MQYKELYNLIRQFTMSHGAESDYQKLDAAIKQSSVDDLLETGELGFTQLLNALYIPFNCIKNNPELSADLSLVIYTLLMKRCEELNNPKLINFFLTQNDTRKYNPLLTIMKTGNAKVLREYLADLEWAMIPGHVSDETAKQLVITINAGNYSSLQEAIVNHDNNNLELYLNFLDRHPNLFAPVMRNLLIHLNDYKSHVVHMNMRSKNQKNKKLLFNFLHTALNLNHITKSDYSDLIISENSDRMSALSCILMHYNPLASSTYFEEILSAYKQKIISPETYKRALFGFTSDNKSPFNFALQGIPKCFAQYLAVVEQDYQQETITKPDYHDFLMGAKQIREMTPLFSGIYLQVAFKAFKSSVLTQLEYSDLCAQFKPKSTLLKYQQSQQKNNNNNNNNTSAKQPKAHQQRRVK